MTAGYGVTFHFHWPCSLHAPKLFPYVSKNNGVTGCSKGLSKSSSSVVASSA